MRLIDADALKEYFKTIRKYHVGKYSEWYLADVLEQQPTVDAVPVIRCKDCKWYYMGGATCMFWDGANSMCGDDYCSRAEREEEHSLEEMKAQGTE